MDRANSLFIQRKYLKPIFSLFLILFTFSLFAQTHHSLRQAEDSLKSIAKSIKEASSDSERMVANDRFHKILDQAVRLPGSFDYPFDSVSILGKMKSHDKRFRIYNWNLPESDGTNVSFCVLQVYNKGKGVYDFFDLHDRSDSIDKPENQLLDANHWYGNLYYKIIENTSATDKIKYYSLLGWIARNSFIAEKIIDVLTFDQNGVPLFGAKIFNNYGDGQGSRVIFKYSASAKMALNYSEMDLPSGKKWTDLLKRSGIKGKKAKMILFDHLIPLDPQLANQYQFYVPEADTYDAFVFSGKGWVFLQEVNARNRPSHVKKVN
jgi:hypothetical protein